MEGLFEAFGFVLSWTVPVEMPEFSGSQDLKSMIRRNVTLSIGIPRFPRVGTCPPELRGDRLRGIELRAIGTVERGRRSQPQR